MHNARTKLSQSLTSYLLCTQSTTGANIYRQCAFLFVCFCCFIWNSNKTSEMKLNETSAPFSLNKASPAVTRVWEQHKRARLTWGQWKFPPAPQTADSTGTPKEQVWLSKHGGANSIQTGNAYHRSALRTSTVIKEELNSSQSLEQNAAGAEEEIRLLHVASGSRYTFRY